MPIAIFREVVRNVQTFLIVRLFPEKEYKLVQISSDWMASSIKLLALLRNLPPTRFIYRLLFIIFHLDCTNQMQIQYYESHYVKFQSDTNKTKSQDDSDSTNDLSTHKKAAASSSLNSVFVSYQEFYIKKLDSFDLFNEYLRWQQLKDNESK
jgi:hypothetical protein